MITMYGIKNCDTIKKARKWLEAEGIEYQFHDYRKDGLDANQLKSWVSELGWEVLLNKRGTTWRKLPDDVRTMLMRPLRLRSCWIIQPSSSVRCWIPVTYAQSVLRMLITHPCWVNKHPQRIKFKLQVIGVTT
jgi:hypothetical protein